jgi:hypothetical protein
MASALVLRYVSSVTLFLEKKETCRHPDAGRMSADVPRAAASPTCSSTG